MCSPFSVKRSARPAGEALVLGSAGTRTPTDQVLEQQRDEVEAEPENDRGHHVGPRPGVGAGGGGGGDQAAEPTSRTTEILRDQRGDDGEGRRDPYPGQRVR